MSVYPTRFTHMCDSGPKEGQVSLESTLHAHQKEFCWVKTFTTPKKDEQGYQFCSKCGEKLPQTREDIGK